MTNQPPPPPPADGSGWSASGGQLAAADLGIRFGARVIDTILFYAVFIILALIVLVPLLVADASGTAGLTQTLGGGGLSGSTIISNLVSMVLIFGFFVVFDTRMGGTPGKLMLGLRINGGSGGNPSVEESVKRNAWLALGIVPVIGWLLQIAATIYVAVTISSDASNLGWHDRFADTRVVRK